MMFFDFQPFRWTIGVEFDEVDDEYGKGYFLSICVPIFAIVFMYGE